MKDVVMHCVQDMGLDSRNDGLDRIVLVRSWRSGSQIPGTRIALMFKFKNCMMHYFKVLFIGVMSCMYALWDVVGMGFPGLHKLRSPLLSL
jgi:hypothetical protein